MNYNWNRLHYSWAQVEEGVKTFSLDCLDVITRKLLLYRVTFMQESESPLTSPSTLKKKNASACVEIYHATNGDISSTSSLRFITLRSSFLSTKQKAKFFLCKACQKRSMNDIVNRGIANNSTNIENTVANNRIFLEKLDEGKGRRENVREGWKENGKRLTWREGRGQVGSRLINDERIEFNSEWITTIQRMLTYDWFYALPSNRLLQVIEFSLDNNCSVKSVIYTDFKKNRNFFSNKKDPRPLNR